MRRAALPALLAVVPLFLSACFGGDDTSSPTATPSRTAATATKAPLTSTPTPPTPSPAPSPSPSPSPVALPERPPRLADYALVIAQHLSDVDVEGCPDALLDAWEIPISPPQRCAQGDTDGDGALELVLVLTPAAPPPEAVSPGEVPVTVAVLDESAGQWSVAYRTPDSLDGGGFVTASFEFNPGPEGVLMVVRDMNGLPGAEVVYRTDFCGAHTCHTTVEVVGWDGSGYADLTQQEVSISFADVALEDRDGDGTTEIVMHGGSIGSIGAGPTRTRTEVYRWNGALWSLAETVNDPSVFLYHAILDADETFAAGDYASAAELYESALVDASLEEWKENEREELEPYMLFRIALSRMAQGGDPEYMDLPLREAVERFPASLHGRMAREFRQTWLAAGDTSAGCAAALAFVQANFDAFDQFWYFGYGNPLFDAQALCPL